MTAAPVAKAAAGRYSVRDGLCTLETTRSPACVARVDSSAVWPSEPGAPLGQSGITFGSASAAYAERVPITGAAASNRQIDLRSVIFRLLLVSGVSIVPPSWADSAACASC